MKKTGCEVFFLWYCEFGMFQNLVSICHLEPEQNHCLPRHAPKPIFHGLWMSVVAG